MNRLHDEHLMLSEKIMLEYLLHPDFHPDAHTYDKIRHIYGQLANMQVNEGKKKKRERKGLIASRVTWA